MRYMLLIYADKTMWDTMSEAEQQAGLQEYRKYSDWLGEKGWMRAGDQLADTDQATTVREADGKTLATDGPFAETKEQLGGYYIVECANLDEAIEAAGEAPGVAVRVGRGPARSSTCEPTAMPRGRRPPVPARVGAGGRDAHPRARRLRPGRGGGAGGVRDRARTLAGDGRPRQPGRVDHDDGPQPGDRPAPPRAARGAGRRTTRRAAPRPRGAGRRHARRSPDDRLRLIFTCCHPALADGGARRAHAPDGRRAVDARDRPRVHRRPSRRSSSGWSARSGRSATPASRTACRRASCCPSGSAACSPCSTWSSTRGTRRPRGRSSASSSATRRSGSRACSTDLLPDEPEALGLLALMLLQHSRRDARVDADGDLVLLEDQDRARWDHDMIDEGVATLDRAMALGAPGPVSGAGGDRRPARAGAAARGHRLAADRGALRRARRAMTPSPVVVAEPRGGGRDGRRPRRRARAGGRRWPTSSTATTCSTRRAPTCSGGCDRPRGGRGRVPARARAGDERTRARVPRATLAAPPFGLTPPTEGLRPGRPEHCPVRPCRASPDRPIGRRGRTDPDRRHLASTTGSGSGASALHPAGPDRGIARARRPCSDGSCRPPKDHGGSPGRSASWRSRCWSRSASNARRGGSSPWSHC